MSLPATDLLGIYVPFVQNLKRLVCAFYLWVIARWLSRPSQAA